jgi:hypothetical protein
MRTRFHAKAITQLSALDMSMSLLYEGNQMSYLSIRESQRQNSTAYVGCGLVFCYGRKQLRRFKVFKIIQPFAKAPSP